MYDKDEEIAPEDLEDEPNQELFDKMVSNPSLLGFIIQIARENTLKNLEKEQENCAEPEQPL